MGLLDCSLFFLFFLEFVRGLGGLGRRNLNLIQDGDGLLWDEVTRCKGEGTVVHHACCQGSHEGVCLCMKVAKHFITAPATNEFDNVRVDFGAEKGHSATCAEAAGRQFGRIQAKRDV